MVLYYKYILYVASRIEQCPHRCPNLCWTLVQPMLYEQSLKEQKQFFFWFFFALMIDEVNYFHTTLLIFLCIPDGYKGYLQCPTKTKMYKNCFVTPTQFAIIFHIWILPPLHIIWSFCRAEIIDHSWSLNRRNFKNV